MLSFDIPEEDLAFYTELAKQFNAARADRERAVLLINGILGSDRFTEAAKELAAALRNLAGNRQLIQSELQKPEFLTDLERNLLAKFDLRDELSDLKTPIKELIDAYRNLLAAIDGIKSIAAQLDQIGLGTSISPDSLVAIVDQLRQIRPQLLQLKSALATLTVRAGAIADLLRSKEFFTGDVLDDVVKTVVVSLKESLLQNPEIKEHFENLLNKAEAFFVATTETFFASAELATIPLDAGAEVLRLAQAAAASTPGVLDLRQRAARSADRGDTVRVVYKEYPCETCEMDHRAQSVINVTNFRLRSHVRTGLVFVNRTDTPEGAPETNFKAAPMVGQLWGIPDRRDPDAAGNRTGQFLRTLSPELGYHVLATDYGDEGDDFGQIGAGVSLHILDSMVQFGYGWNLHADSDRTYMFIGLGLIEIGQSIRSNFFNRR